MIANGFDIARGMVEARPTKDEHLKNLGAADDWVAGRGVEDSVVAQAFLRGRELHKGEDLHLAVAASYLQNWREKADEPDVPTELAAAQMLSFARICAEKGDDNVFVDEAFSSVKPEMTWPIATEVFAMRNIELEEFKVLAPELDGMLFPPVSQDDREMANDAIHAFNNNVKLKGFDGKVVNAIGSLDSIDGFPMLRPAVARIYHDRRVTGKEPSVADIGIRIASDMVTQCQAQAILYEEKDTSNGFFRLRRATNTNDAVRREIEAQANGNFSAMSPGACLEIRSDIIRGRILPTSMSNLIRRNARVHDEAKEFHIPQPANDSLGFGA
ncbi:hypothetical protein [Croceicoccus gelatinilyticus]|uniref:hypothetical protein n=1 Tax=Croceicoccus gelatinilyticus TaxID=2835536 RepID=UPI001BCE1E21|nr:hypothetical protein [Croceicoccus gelatinilyticus]MBS7671733.1 hypothetical protein [Croceicoccus gelatinilyticus]